MKADDQVQEILDATVNDPLLWCRTVYPWGVEGSELARFELHPWHVDVLTYIGEQLRRPRDVHNRVIKISVASGHGIGKSALMGMLIDWFMGTTYMGRGVVTAGKEEQLKSKTWAELAKWRRLNLVTGGEDAEHWFRWSKTKIAQVDHEEEWQISATPWSEHNSEAFAGLHNYGRRIFLGMDEASIIPDIIHEVASGALTDKDTDILFLMFGNMTRASGAFYRSHHGQSHRWKNFNVDSRDVPTANQEEIEGWIEDWGIDSDRIRVRVRGLPPLQGEHQFIAREVVSEALKRDAVFIRETPLILGLDFARAGDNQTKGVLRRGRDCKTHAPITFRHDISRDSARLIDAVMNVVNDIRPHAIFGDETGVGGPIIDVLRSRGVPIQGVQGAGRPSNPERYANKRAECWCRMKEWLLTGALWDDGKEAWHKDLCQIESGFDRGGEGDKILLESKKELLKRGEKSPDLADALSLTFAEPVLEAVQSLYDPRGPLGRPSRMPATASFDYDPHQEGA